MKSYNDAALAAFEAGTALVVGALTIEIDPEDPDRIWGGHYDITVDGDTYRGIGNMLLLDAIGGALGGTEGSLDLVMSAVDPAELAKLDMVGARRAPVVLHELIFDQHGSVLLDSSVLKRGRIAEMPRTETIGGTAEIKISIETAASGLARGGARQRSYQDQLLIDPADESMRDLTMAPNKTTYWGGEPPQSAGNALPGTNGGPSGGLHIMGPGGLLR